MIMIDAEIGEIILGQKWGRVSDQDVTRNCSNWCVKMPKKKALGRLCAFPSCVLSIQIAVAFI